MSDTKRAERRYKTTNKKGDARTCERQVVELHVRVAQIGCPTTVAVAAVA